MAFYGGQQVGLNLGGQATNAFELQAGEVMVIPPGFWKFAHGPYIATQVLDPIMGIWRAVGTDGNQTREIQSDGTNYRLANQTGCVVGVLITNAGTSYPAATTCTASAGSAKFQVVVGGAVSATVTVPTGGSNYTYAPNVVFAAPPSPGVQATGYATISGGAVTAVTVTDQGAGYTSPPLCALVNDFRDTTGGGATATTTLTGAGTITAILVTDHGNSVTALPTLTITGTGGSGVAATCIMNWSVTGVTITGAGGGYSVTNNAVSITTVGTGIPTTAAAYTNPQSQASLLRARPAQIQVTTLNGGALTSTGLVILDGGCIGGIAGNVAFQQLSGSAIGTLATLALQVGGTNDFVYLQHA